MDSAVFKNVLVRKPWGCEALLYANRQVELWHLDINHGHRTSTHCHPGKLSGLIVLDGQAEVSFLNNKIQLGKLDKVMIRRGLFHSTKCLSPGRVSLLEIETPPDKSDLVRFEDPYGRAGQPYESPDCYRPDFGHIRFDEHNKSYELDGCVLKVIKLTAGQPPPSDLMVVLAGGLVVPDAPNKYVLSAGDVISDQTFQKLTTKFVVRDLELLLLSRKDQSDGQTS